MQSDILEPTPPDGQHEREGSMANPTDAVLFVPSQGLHAAQGVRPSAQPWEWEGPNLGTSCFNGTPPPRQDAKSANTSPPPYIALENSQQISTLGESLCETYRVGAWKHVHLDCNPQNPQFRKQRRINLKCAASALSPKFINVILLSPRPLRRGGGF